MTAGGRAEVARALGVLATAVRLGLVVDEPRGVIVRGNELIARDRAWLVQGFGPTETLLIGAELEIRGLLLGRVYRLVLSPARHRELLAVLAKAGA